MGGGQHFAGRKGGVTAGSQGFHEMVLQPGRLSRRATAVGFVGLFHYYYFLKPFLLGKLTVGITASCLLIYAVASFVDEFIIFPPVLIWS